MGFGNSGAGRNEFTGGPHCHVNKWKPNRCSLVCCLCCLQGHQTYNCAISLAKVLFGILDPFFILSFIYLSSPEEEGHFQM